MVLIVGEGRVTRGCTRVGCKEGGDNIGHGGNMLMLADSDCVRFVGVFIKEEDGDVGDEVCGSQEP